MSPDGSAKLPPEEKLLQLIRGRTVKRPGSQPVQSAASAVPVAVVIRRPRAGFSFPWSSVAVGVLSVVLAIEIVGLILEAFWPLPPITTPRLPSVGSSAGSSKTVTFEEMPSLSASVSRPLFAASVANSSMGTDQTAHAAPSVTAQLLAARLTLMGIVAGNPAQAIIEDSQTKKTYFVKVGQPVVEGAVLENVLEHRAILNLNGEKIELTL